MLVRSWSLALVPFHRGFLLIGFSMLLSCSSVADNVHSGAPQGDTVKTVPAKEIITDRKMASAAEILARPQVPILCYHQIRNWRAGDSKQAKDYIVPEQTFAEQLKMLHDSGYHTISTDELYNYLCYGAALPSKPILLTFDDTDLPQFTIAKPVMEKYGFKGMFFIMTVSLGRPNYMSREQVKQLSDAGHEIGSHTWDHKNIKQYVDADWVTQIDKPTKTLESITGKPVQYFAYPFGLWNTAVIPNLKAHGFKAAFQLSAKRDNNDPLYTIRRIIVPGSWTAANLSAWIKHSF
jgi:peptidoglycan/xylan/chitin deacetylase (PgdA/CDA1 family)